MSQDNAGACQRQRNRVDAQYVDPVLRHDMDEVVEPFGVDQLGAALDHVGL